MPATPAYPSPRLASASPMRGDPYAYYQQETSGRTDTADYVLGPGDKMRLIVFGETDLSGEFTIDGSGFVRLPLIGQVRAAGYTSQQLEAAIGGALAQGYLKQPRVSVEVSTYRPFYIIGAVNRPGQYPYVDHMNALNAIALAGGFTPIGGGERGVHPPRRQQYRTGSAGGPHHHHPPRRRAEGAQHPVLRCGELPVAAVRRRRRRCRAAAVQ